MFNIFDWVIIGVLALFLMIGAYKGFLKTALSLAAWGISIALIYFFGAQLGEWLMGTGLGDTLTDAFAGLIKGEHADAIIGLEGDKLIVVGTGLTLAQALGAMNVPGFLVNIMGNSITAGESVARGVGGAVAKYVCIAIVALVLLITVAVIFKIISVATHKSLKRLRLSGVNRLIGGVLYGGIGVLVLSAAMLVIDAMSSLSFMSEVLQYRSQGVISNWFALNNPIKLLVELVAAKT